MGALVGPDEIEAFTGRVGRLYPEAVEREPAASAAT
jgi:hypothetical protein